MKLLLISAAALSCAVLQAQNNDTSYWTKSAEMALNFSQASFSPNWKAGGVNNLTFTSIYNARLSYKKDRRGWENRLSAIYGLVTIGKDTRKSQDNWSFNSDIDEDLNKKWKAYAGLTIQSQFDKGYRYDGDGSRHVVSDIFSPGFITEAIGLKYNPKAYWWVKSGAALRHTIVRDQRLYNDSLLVKNNKVYGVEKGQVVRSELGVQFASEFDKDLDTEKKFHLTMRYMSFLPGSAFSQNLYGWDHRGEFMLSAKLLKYVQVSFAAIGIFDKEQDYNWQLSQQLGVGFVYKW